MKSNYFYYKLKPLIPRSLQIWARRRITQKKLKKYSHIWPIDERAGKAPEEWRGWPEGKKFALVLTHDVESEKGLKNVIELAKLEESLGFRSSLNFVAEDYEVPQEIIDYLRNHGFEIGIHGLKHDGNIFRSYRYFKKQIPKINEYLKKWGAVGFRAPSMYHNLDWVGELNIEYDSSTFDTDPFEPQPDGVGTIFPFLVPRPKPIPAPRNSQPATHNLQPATRNPQPATRNSQPPTYNPELATRNSQPAIINTELATYNSETQNKDSSPHPSPLTPHGNCASNYFVELPYTLPQDHLLFILLQEKDITIWKEKLDWIARKGGMALILTHTDYMSFNGAGSEITYPIDYYIKFLEYVKSTYEGIYWHTLPHKIAHFYKNLISSKIVQ